MKRIITLAIFSLGLFSITAYGQTEKSTASKELTTFEAIQASPKHTIFTKGLIQTGLDKLLSEETPYAVFAPTDDSFKGREGLVETLFKEENNDFLLRIWSMHIMKSTFEPEQIGSLSGSSDGFKNIKVTTLLDQKFTIEKMKQAFVLKPGNKQNVFFMPQDGSCKNGWFYSTYDFIFLEN